MKNRISVLFSVILGALLITSCSSVFQPNKKVADIEVKASLSGIMARDITGSSQTEDDYSFINDMLYSSDNQSYTYYEIISTLMSEYGLSEDAAYDVLADKMLNLNFSNYANYWMQIKTNFGQESEKVYPYVDLIKSYYKAAIKPAYIYYSFLEKAKALSDGQPDYEALAVYITNPDAREEFENLSKELEASTTTTLPDYNFDFSTVSLKLNSVPFDQEVTFTLLINYTEKEGPKEYTFTRFVNPGLNVFDFTPDQTTYTGSDVIDDDNDDSDGEGTTTVIIEDNNTEDDDDTDPWADYTKYYITNEPGSSPDGTETNPMSLTAAFDKCREKFSEGTSTKFAIILKDNITLSETLTVPESAYIVITGNYGTSSTKTISAASSFENQLFSIDNYANLGLSSVILNGNSKCLLFYCSHSVNEGDTETDPDSLTGTFTMENCTVTNFLGTEKVGIITMATGGEMNITGCTFRNNTVRDTGAIYLNNGTLNLNGNDLLDSTLSTLDTINTNSFADPYATASVIPCEIYLKGTGLFNDTNIFLNSNLYAVHVAGWATLTLNDTYYSVNGNEEVLYIYSSTDGSLSDEDPGINTIEVDVEGKVNISDGGDKNGNKETPTYEVITYQDQVVITE